MKLVRILYNITLYTFFFISLPFHIYKGILKKKFGKCFFERFGFISSKKLKKLDKNKKSIIIHAVSVGEMITAMPLVKSLNANYGKTYNIIITVTTVTGYSIAEKQKPANVHLFYFPLDLHGSVNRSLKKLNPSMVILMETELWPNFILSAAKKNINMLVVNGRISEKSFDRYKKITFIFSAVSKHIKLFSVQTKDDYDRLNQLGVPANKIFINGNMKMDMPIKNISAQEIADLKEKLNINPERKIITAGSTHPGEEKILASIYNDLNENKSLFLILVPRHTERSLQIENTLKAQGFKTALRTKNNCTDDTDILIVDTIGELMHFYAIADIVFVGKSLFAPGGGQNMIEPVSLGKPTLFGQHVSNFKQIAQGMAQEKCAIMVSDERNLKANLTHMLDNEENCANLKKNCLSFMEQHKGALDKNLNLISRNIDH